VSLMQDAMACESAEVAVDSAEPVYAELWISLASLLRSYTALHGLNGNRVATIEANAASILTRYEKKRLELQRSHATVSWMRENGDSGRLELTLDGRLRETNANGVREEEMDMAAEAWARELMLEFKP
jgi:cell division inhibitor SulA